MEKRDIYFDRVRMKGRQQNGEQRGGRILISLGYIHDFLVVQRATPERSIRSLVCHILACFSEFMISPEQTTKHLKIGLKEGILKELCTNMYLEKSLPWQP